MCDPRYGYPDTVVFNRDLKNGNVEVLCLCGTALELDLPCEHYAYAYLDGTVEGKETADSCPVCGQPITLPAWGDW